MFSPKGSVHQFSNPHGEPARALIIQSDPPATIQLPKSKMQLSNYLFFTTSCEQALDFYTACGLGRVALAVRHGENGMPVRTESMRGKIMHAQFEGPGVRFFASDNDDAEPMRGSAMIFMLDDRAQTRDLFGRLAQGGQVTTPLAVQPWGDYFGKLTDRFGVQWMFNCSSKD